MKPQRRIKMPLRRPPQKPRPPAGTKMRAKAATVEDSYDDEEDYEDEEPNMKFSHALLVVLILHVIAVGGVFAFNSIKAKQTNEKATAKTSEVAEANAVAATSEPAPAATKPSVPEKPVVTSTTTTTTKAAPPTAATSAGKVHTVVAGDTLSKIASKYSVSVEALEKANGLTTYSMIRVGQELQIPVKSGSSAPVAAIKEKADITPVKSTATTSGSGAISSVPKPTPTDTAIQAATTKAPTPAAVEKPAATQTAGAAGEVSGEVYVVAKGDNPYSIAKRFGISYTELLKVNDIQDPTKIQIGQKLKVPAKTN